MGKDLFGTINSQSVNKHGRRRHDDRGEDGEDAEDDNKDDERRVVIVYCGWSAGVRVP